MSGASRSSNESRPEIINACSRFKGRSRSIWWVYFCFLTCSHKREVARRQLSLWRFCQCNASRVLRRRLGALVAGSLQSLRLFPRISRPTLSHFNAERLSRDWQCMQLLRDCTGRFRASWRTIDVEHGGAATDIASDQRCSSRCRGPINSE